MEYGRILLCDTTELMQEAAYSRAYALVPPERRQKADRFRFRKDQNLCLAAGLLLRSGLQALGLPPEDTGIAFTHYGKPYLIGHPQVQFSLSHSGSWAMCAVSGQSVGCDIQKIGPTDLDIARRFFGPEERERIFSRESAQAQLEEFYRCWTLRESYIKAIGMGMYLDPGRYALTFSDGVGVRRDGVPETWYFTEPEPVPGCRIAVCSAAPLPFLREERTIDELLL